MLRTSIASLRAALFLVGPTVLAGCPDDTTPSGTTDETGSSSGGDSSSSGATATIDPDTSSSTDPTVTTVDPDSSSSGDASSSSSSSSGPGFDGCGDGDIDDGELCDGDNLDGRDCASEDFVDGVLACNADCTLDTSGCNYACGDGNVQGDEQCEADDLDGATCVTQGFDGGNLDCNADCTFDVSGCETYTCGDDVHAGPEVCDGTDLDGETCLTQGFDSGTLACAADCTGFDTTGCFVCGDGIINGDEVCDGADLAGQDCISQGLDGGSLSCAADCTFDLSECTGCGNGDQDPGEECDGNDLGGVTCLGLGFDGGQPTCAPDCVIVPESCFGQHTFCASPGTAIGPGAGALNVSTIPVAGLAGVVTDVDVLVDASHTAVGDLQLDVRYVDADLSVALADAQCGVDDDINATFDQDAAGPPACGGPPAFASAVLPLGDLDAYAGSIGAGNGSWELSVLDQAAGNGGTLDQWCVSLTTETDGESFAYVVNDTSPNSITAYTVADDGTLAEIAGSPFSTGGDSSFNHHPNAVVSCGPYLYAANYNSGSIGGFSVAGDGSLAALPGSPFVSPGVVSLACTSSFLYASNFGTTVERFSIDGAGALTSLGTTNAGASTLGMTLHEASGRLVVAGWSSSVNVFDIDGAGDLTPVPGSPFNTGGSNHSASISPNGALVATEGINAVNLYVVADDGSLAPAVGSPFADPSGCETVGLAWSPDSTRLFVGHRGCFPGQIMVYDVAPDGVLTPVAGAPFASGGNEAVGLAVAFDGSRVYATHINDNLTAVLDVGAGGALTPVVGSPFANNTFGNHSWIVLR
jgi:6-phosphogluconolactonase (cycloisomerase 2 family)